MVLIIKEVKINLVGAEAKINREVTDSKTLITEVVKIISISKEIQSKMAIKPLNQANREGDVVEVKPTKVITKETKMILTQNPKMHTKK